VVNFENHPQVTPEMSVVQLKHLISPQLCVPVAEQKLLILGKPLQGMSVN
jgi:hypothetical protein